MTWHEKAHESFVVRIIASFIQRHAILIDLFDAEGKEVASGVEGEGFIFRS